MPLGSSYRAPPPEGASPILPAPKSETILTRISGHAPALTVIESRHLARDAERGHPVHACVYEKVDDLAGAGFVDIT